MAWYRSVMGRSSSKEIAAYLQWRIKEWVRSGKTARELAKAAGISAPQVSDIVNGNTGAGWKAAEGLGRAFGLTMIELMTTAEEWAKAQPPTLPAPPAASPPGARRALAAQLAREDGISEEAVKDVLEGARPEDEGRSTVWWILKMRRRDLELASPAEVQPQRTVTRRRA